MYADHMGVNCCRPYRCSARIIELGIISESGDPIVLRIWGPKLEWDLRQRSPHLHSCNKLDPAEATPRPTLVDRRQALTDRPVHSAIWLG